MRDAFTAVSVDLDDLDCYHAVHGIGDPAPRVALTRWLPRFLTLFDALRVRATFFVIGRDLEADLDAAGEGAANLRRAVAAGHELASHSYAHDYRMSSWEVGDIRTDLARCDRLLRRLGATPAGFRAPGYTHGAALMGAVAEAGYRYDSSVLPSPAYFVGKVGVMAAMALRGRRSASSLRGGRTFLGPTAPHRRRDAALVELPISVTPILRLPIIGTTILGGPDWVRRRIVQTARHLPGLNLELHAIDLADARRDGIEAQLAELAEPLSVREARLRGLLSSRDAFCTLGELAAAVEPIPSR